jgi:hypothetical protein
MRASVFSVMDWALRWSKIPTSVKTSVGSWWRRLVDEAPHSYWRFLPTADSGQESAIRQAEASATFSSPTTSRQIMRSCVHGGVRFLEDPRSERYGRVAVFVDPWGGKWDLLEPTGRGGDVV